jgi:hypothetical protein
VQDGVRLDRLDRGENDSGLFRLGQNEIGARFHRSAVAFGEIVIDRDSMSGIEQFFRANGSNITGTAGDKDVHAGSVKKNGDSENSKVKKPPGACGRFDGFK